MTVIVDSKIGMRKKTAKGVDITKEYAYVEMVKYEALPTATKSIKEGAH